MPNGASWNYCCCPNPADAPSNTPTVKCRSPLDNAVARQYAAAPDAGVKLDPCRIRSSAVVRFVAAGLLTGRAENRGMPGAGRNLLSAGICPNPAQQGAAADGGKQRTAFVGRKLAPFVAPSAVKPRAGCAARRAGMLVRLGINRAAGYSCREVR